MDHATIRSLRRWLTAAAVLTAGFMGATWADATDAPSNPQLWFRVALAMTALTCIAVVGGRLRRQERASRIPERGISDDAAESTGAERSTTA